VFDRNWARCQRFTLLACRGDEFRLVQSFVAPFIKHNLIQ
jgi:hypothetical protein